jgi:hypothetical protein
MASAVSTDPQSWNRYSFVLNNPLRYVDPDGMMAEPWDQLTSEQQEKIASKLNIQQGQTAQQAFNGLFNDRSQEETAAIITGLQLALDEIPSDSKLWDQISTFDGGWMKKDESVGLVFSVKNDEAFLNAARESGYVVNDLNEVFNVGSGHKNSVRQTTQTSYDPALHFVQQNGYAATRFDAHFDPRSPYFKERDKVTYPDFRDYPGPQASGERSEMISAAAAHKETSIYRIKRIKEERAAQRKKK